MPNVKAGVNVSWIELLINPATATISTTHKNGTLFLLHQIAKLIASSYAENIGGVSAQVKNTSQGAWTVIITIIPSADGETRRRAAKVP
jgi:hypothetical protein